MLYMLSNLEISITFDVCIHFRTSNAGIDCSKINNSAQCVQLLVEGD